jgi:hypothetical protein
MLRFAGHLRNRHKNRLALRNARAMSKEIRGVRAEAAIACPRAW